jgi:hypothetical protein
MSIPHVHITVPQQPHHDSIILDEVENVEVMVFAQSV